MDRLTIRLFAALVLTLSCTVCAAPSSRWISRADGTAPTAADSGDRRNQARRQAEPGLPRGPSYPPSPQPASSTESVPVDLDRYPAEDAFYAQCMTRKGFELVSLPQRSR